MKNSLKEARGEKALLHFTESVNIQQWSQYFIWKIAWKKQEGGKALLHFAERVNIQQWSQYFVWKIAKKKQEGGKLWYTLQKGLISNSGANILYEK